MSFLSFNVDGLNYLCDGQGFPIFGKRKSPRKCTINEAHTEREFLQRMAAENQDIKTTEAYKWFEKKLGKPNWNDMSALGRLISRLTNIEFPREAYRRANTTLYWFHMNWNNIVHFLRIHKVLGYHSKKGIISFDVPLVLPKIIWIIQ